jgi:K+ transporter
LATGRLAGLADADHLLVGRHILLIPPAHLGLPLLQDKLLLLMMRLAGSATEYYRLPPGRAVELGSQVQL